MRPDTFKEFIKYIFDNLQEKEAKTKVNNFIGYLGLKYDRINHGFTCTEYETAINCWTTAMSDQKNVSIDHYKDTFLIKEQTINCIFSDHTSINRFVISEAILRLLQLIEACHGDDSVLYGYNTDGIYITNPKKTFKNKKNVKFNTSKIGKAYVTDSEVHYFKKHYRENMDMSDYEMVNGKGCIYNGQAGSGKTNKLCQIVKETDNPLVLSFTNKDVENVKSRLTKMVFTTVEVNKICHTFDSYFCEWNGRDIESLKNKTIFIEEFSMVPNKWMTLIYKAFTMYNIKVYLFGDHNQCSPVECGSQINHDYLSSSSICKMCPNVVTLEYIEKSCRYDKRTHDMLKTFLKHGKVSTYLQPIDTKLYKNMLPKFDKSKSQH